MYKIKYILSTLQLFDCLIIPFIMHATLRRALLKAGIIGSRIENFVWHDIARRTNLFAIRELTPNFHIKRLQILFIKV